MTTTPSPERQPLRVIRFGTPAWRRMVADHRRVRLAARVKVQRN